MEPPEATLDGKDNGLTLRLGDGILVLALSGPVDRELAGRADAALRRLLVEHDGAVAIDVSGVDAVNGTVLGVLLRASRRLGWRNRHLYVVCVNPDACTRLRIAGIDELATIVDAVPAGDSVRPR
jgi:anti-anti-sigma regulatory factor